MIFSRERSHHPVKSDIKSTQRNKGFHDLLSYLCIVDDNTIVHKDGAFSKHFKLVLPDLSARSAPESILVQRAWQQAIQHGGDGWLFEVNHISMPLTLIEKNDSFPDKVSELLNLERELAFASGAYFESHYYLSLTYKPKRLTPSRLKQFVMNESVHEEDVFAELDNFSKIVDEIVGALEVELGVFPLEKNQLTSYLHQCITGSADELRIPKVGHFLDTYLSREDFTADFQPMIGDKRISVLAIDDLPEKAYAGLLDSLSAIPVSYRWSTRFIPMDSQTANSHLKQRERNWSSKAIGLMGVIRESMGMPANLDRDASNMVQAVRDAQHSNSEGQIRFGFYNSTIILMDSDVDKLNVTTQAIVHLIQQQCFRVRVENANATQAYLGSLPGHGGYNVRQLLVDSVYVGCALPNSAPYTGEKKSPCPLYPTDAPALLMSATEGNRPFYFNLHVGDVGHTAILGPTGMGKSTLIAALIAAHRRYEGSRVIVLDKDKSHELIVRALGGVYVDLNAQSSSLAPLSFLQDENDEVAIGLATQWLLDCCTLQGVNITPHQRLAMNDAVKRLSAEPPCYKNLNHLTLQDAVLREALHALNTSQYHHLLNGTQSDLIEKSIIGLDMSGLLSTSDMIGPESLSVIKALFLELEKGFEDRRPTLLVLEEAWLYLKHPVFQSKLTDWFKTLRKFNVAVIFVSQDLSDIAASSASSVIQNSCMTRLYLPNPSATEPAVKQFYDAFGLNEQQIALLQHARPKQDYYYVSPKGSRLFHLDLGELAKAFLCVSNPQSIARFKQRYDANPDNWLTAWLEENQLHDWCEMLNQKTLEHNNA